jgi:hypothetical protein
MCEEAECYALTGPLPPLAIPSTLHDSLMARLDRLATAKAVAQLGAVLGREFAYELIRAVAPMDEATVQQGLAQLVDAELLYQRGSPLPTQYLFKHALIQETAYQSLLKSTRQHYHQRSARYWRRSSPRSSRRSPSWSRGTIPRPDSPSRPFPTGSEPGSRPCSARPTRKPSTTREPPWSYSRPSRSYPTVTNKSSTFRSSSVGH